MKNKILRITDELLNKFVLKVGGFDHFYDRIIFKRTTYTTSKNKSKFNNSCICANKKYGIIELIATKNKLVFVICRRINVLHHIFYDLNFKSLKHSSFYCDVSDNEFFCCLTNN